MFVIGKNVRQLCVCISIHVWETFDIHSECSVRNYINYRDTSKTTPLCQCPIIYTLIYSLGALKYEENKLWVSRKYDNISVLTFPDDLQFLRVSVFVCSCACLSVPLESWSLNNSAGVDLSEADRIKHLTHCHNYYSVCSKWIQFHWGAETNIRSETNTRDAGCALLSCIKLTV